MWRDRLPFNFSYWGPEKIYDIDNTSGNITIDYEWSPDVLTYLRYATGYKSGGYFSRTPINRLRANLAVFYSEYDDMQISQFLPGTGDAWRAVRLRTHGVW